MWKSMLRAKAVPITATTQSSLYIINDYTKKCILLVLKLNGFDWNGEKPDGGTIVGKRN